MMVGRDPLSFTDRIPPSFDGYGDYQHFKENVLLWDSITGIDPRKRAATLIGHLTGQAQVIAKTLPLSTLTAEDGLVSLLSELDQKFGLDETSILHNHISQFFDHTWTKDLSVEEFVIGFHSRLDKITSLKLDDLLKGHLLLRQANLDPYDRNIIVGSAGGNYSLQSISVALKNAYRTGGFPTASMNSTPPQQGQPSRRDNSAHHRRPRRNNQDANNPSNRAPMKRHQDRRSRNQQKPEFLLFYTQYDDSYATTEGPAAIVDSGACASIVGKNTLDAAMHALNISELKDADIRHAEHRFGPSRKPTKTIFAVRVPFVCTGKNLQGKVRFDIRFDVIEGNLPFLIGLPTLQAMNSTLSFKYQNITLAVNGVLHRLNLDMGSSHLMLPLRPTITHSRKLQLHDNQRDPKNLGQRRNRGGRHNYHYYTPSNPTSKMYVVPKTTTTANNLSQDGHPKLAVAPTTKNSANKNYVVPDATPTSNKKATAKIGRTLSNNELRKLHLQLGHGTLTQTKEFIRSARMWKENYGARLEKIISSCPCVLEKPPPPRPVCSKAVAPTTPQEEVAVDIVYFRSKPFLHSIDLCTKWSETGYLRTKRLCDQIKTFTKIQLYRHGVPANIRGDQEYNKTEFRDFCGSINATLVPVAANHHEGNTVVERANRTIRSYFNRLALAEPQTDLINLVAAATYHKNTCRGHNKASPFELLYGRPPRISGICNPDTHGNIQDVTADAQRRQLQAALKSSTRRAIHTKVGESVYIWRDGSGWIGPASVIAVREHEIDVLHNGHVKTADKFRIRNAPALTGMWGENENNAENTPPTPPSNPINQDNTQQDPEVADEPVDPRVRTRLRREAREVAREAKEFTGQLPARRLRGSQDNSPTTHAIAPHELTTNDRENPKKVSLDAIPQLIPDLSTPAPGDRMEGSEIIAKDSIESESEPNVTVPEYNDPAVYLATRKSTQPGRELSAEQKAEAYNKERSSWVANKAFKRIPRRSVPSDSNIVGSHIIYKRKPDGTPKARIVPWGHRDLEKDNLRGDAPSMNLNCLRLMISLAVERGWEIRKMDVKTAYLQARGFNRTIYVRPPREENDPTGLWLLLAAAYGLTESGRLWYFTSYAALTKNFGARQSRYEPCLYFLRRDAESLLVVVQVDDYAYTGTPAIVAEFESFLQGEFNVGSLESNEFEIMGARLTQLPTGAVTLDAKEKLSATHPCTSDNTKGDRTATATELTDYQSLIGKLLYIGRLASPVASFIASDAATKSGNLQLHHLRALDAALQSLKTTAALVNFQPPQAQPFHLEAMSDASMHQLADKTNVREGIIIFRRSGTIVHAISWMSRLARRVARSTSTAELLAAADAVDMVTHLKHVLEEFSGPQTTTLTVDSKCVFHLCSTLKEPEEEKNKVLLASIREEYHIKSLRCIRWTPGKTHLADALTKKNVEAAHILDQVLYSGRHERHHESTTALSDVPEPHFN